MTRPREARAKSTGFLTSQGRYRYSVAEKVLAQLRGLNNASNH